MNDDFSAFNEVGGFRAKLWRGESTCVLGFDVDEPEPDFVGFAVEFREPGETTFDNLCNRLSFDAPDRVDGLRTFPTLRAPIPTYRWVHFPWKPRLVSTHTGSPRCTWSGAEDPWYTKFYLSGSRRERDRITFSRR